MSAIIDGNVTTLIAAAVLWLRGSGTIRGFAQTLALGIVVSMFTALVITRLIIYSFYGIGIRNKKLYGRLLKKRKTIDFLWKEKSVLRALYRDVPQRICIHGNQSCPRNRRYELQPGLRRRNVYDRNIRPGIHAGRSGQRDGSGSGRDYRRCLISRYRQYVTPTR